MYSSRKGTWNIGRTRNETRIVNNNYGMTDAVNLRDMEELGNTSNYIRERHNSLRGGGIQLPQDDIHFTMPGYEPGKVYPMNRDGNFQDIQHNG